MDLTILRSQNWNVFLRWWHPTSRTGVFLAKGGKNGGEQKQLLPQQLGVWWMFLAGRYKESLSISQNQTWMTETSWEVS